MVRALAIAAILSVSFVGSSVSAAPDRLEDGAVPAQPADRLRPEPRTLVDTKAVIISDSAMAGVRWQGALDGFRGFDADDRLESCRRLVATSCNGREGRRPATALAEINSLAPPGPTDVLIIAVGYNDFSGRFATDLRMILNAARAKGFTTVAWVNYRDEVSYTLPRDYNGARSNYAQMNAELDALLASGEYPELRVWDLDGYTEDTVGWFTSDGVHERRLGAWGVADWVSRQMAHLDNKPCPMAWRPLWRQNLVCPDPDELPDIYGYPDLVGLYGL